jgi:predicted dehydrogenase
MLLAKCSHDIDLIVWMMGGVRPSAVASFGSRMHFRPEKAPPRAGTRCLVDCPLEPDCLYSARKLYLDHPDRWAFYVWESLEHLGEPTLDDKAESLRTDNRFGRCVWKCDNDLVDHQSVAIEFANGATATHNMVGGSARGSRPIHIVGTTGEIVGNFEDGRFLIRRIDPRPGREHAEEVIDLREGSDKDGAFGGHGGGDLRLVADFCRVLRGRPPSLSTTTLSDSLHGHLICFRADEAMRERRTVDLSDGVGG